MTPARSIPTSREYWELKAEQVLNRVFEPEKPIEVEICDTPLVFSGEAPIQPNDRLAVGLNGLAAKPEQVPAAGLGANAIPSPRQGTSRLERSHAWIDQLGQQPTLVLAGASVAVTILAGLAMTLVTSWNQSQLAIREERNMLMIERLRAMGPASPAAAAKPTQSGVAENVAAQEGELQPPPPGEAWMEELASLPASSAPTAEVLKVPINNRITSPAPAATGSSINGEIASRGTSSDNMPQLVGIVQVPGQSGSAIFQIGDSSTSAAVGEGIGSSGWRLRLASGNSALIERGGEQRRLHISSGF